MAILVPMPPQSFRSSCDARSRAMQRRTWLGPVACRIRHGPLSGRTRQAFAGRAGHQGHSPLRDSRPATHRSLAHSGGIQSTTGARTGYVFNVEVSEEHRRKGYAKRHKNSKRSHENLACLRSAFMCSRSTQPPRVCMNPSATGLRVSPWKNLAAVTAASNLSIERTPSGRLRLPAAAAHGER